MTMIHTYIRILSYIHTTAPDSLQRRPKGRGRLFLIHPYTLARHFQIPISMPLCSPNTPQPPQHMRIHMYTRHTHTIHLLPLVRAFSPSFSPPTSHSHSHRGSRSRSHTLTLTLTLTIHITIHTHIHSLPTSRTHIHLIVIAIAIPRRIATTIMIMILMRLLLLLPRIRPRVHMRGWGRGRMRGVNGCSITVERLV